MPESVLLQERSAPQFAANDPGMIDRALRQSVGAYYIRGCLQGAVRKGHDPVGLLRAAQIDASVYSDPDARISGEEFQRLIMAVRRELNDEYLGFMETPGKLEMSYMVSRATVKCKTFGQAMTKFVRLVAAVRSDLDIDIDLTGSDDIVMSFKAKGFARAVEPHLLTWFNLYWVYKFQCWLIGERIRLSGVGFSTSKPEGALDYCQFFDCPTAFDQPCTHLRFERAYLNAPVIRSEVELRDRDFAYGLNNWFEIPGRNQSLSSRVEQVLVDLYRERTGPVTLDMIGDIMCCSPRTLSRKLQRENISFQEIKVKVRRELAQRLLSSTDLTIADIAEEVGFAEPADFTRAYVAWTGRTPSDFRAQRRKPVETALR